MSGGGAGGKGAAAPVPPASRKLVQSLKEIVNRPEAEIYAALRECGMDPDEAVSRLLSQDTFQEVKSKREKKKESKETPEPRSRPGNNSTSRGVRGGADRGGRNSSVHSSSADNMAPRLSASGSGLPSTNSNQKQPFSSASVNKQMVADGPAVPSQASSGIQHNTWSGVPGQLSMADIVKMGRPQPKHSSKDVVAADRGYAGQYPSLTSTENQNPKQHASTVMPTEVERETPPLQDSVQVKNHHSAVDNKHKYQNDWTPQDEPTHANQSFLPETSVDPYETSLQSSSQVDDVVNSHENSHFDENNIGALRPVAASGRHSERDEGISEYNDGLLMNSNSYQLQKYPYTEGDVEVSNADVSAATVNFQNLSLHNGELTGKQIAEDNPAVIIPDHLQVTNTECAYLSFGSFESGAFSGFLPHKTTDSNVELHVREESAPTDQIDARKQDYYDNSAVTSSANINLEAMMGNTENVDGPSVSQADVLRQDVVDPSGLQYDLPSVANQTFSNTSTSQPSTMEDPQGNNQAHTLSHLSNLMGNPLSTSLLGSNQSALHDLEYSLPPYLAQKYNADPTAKPRPAVTMQEALKTGVFPDAHSTHNLPSTSIPTGPPPPQPQQLAAPGHPYSQHTVPLPFTNMIGYPYLPQNYAAYLPSIFQQAYASNGPFHQSAAAVPGSGMKYMQEYKNTLSAAGLQQQPSSAISGYGGGYGSSSNLAGNFTLNQNTGSTPSTLGFDDALSRQFKDNSQYLAHQQGDNSAMWLHGSGSRTAAGLPPNHLYAYQGQSQQGGFRQAQQPQPSQFGGHGYPNYYGSQGSLAQEQHPQNLVDGSLNGFQAAPSQPSLPSWQHQRNY